MFEPLAATRLANPIFADDSIVPKSANSEKTAKSAKSVTPSRTAKVAKPADTAKSARHANSPQPTDARRGTNPQLSIIDAHLELSADGLVPSPAYEDTRVKGMVKHVAGLLCDKVSEPTWIAREFAEQVAKIDSLRFNRVSVLCVKDSRHNWRVKKHADGKVLSLTYKRNLATFSKWNLARNLFVLLSRIVDSTMRLALGPDFRVQLKEDCVTVESRINRVCITVPRQISL